MSFQKVAWVCALAALLVIGTRDARAGQLRFDILRQSAWQPYLGFTPGPEAGPDYSLKIFDQSGTLQMSWISGAGFNHNGLQFSTFEDLRSLALRVEYKPTSSADTSVYRLTLDAPDWSTASLPAPRPTANPNLTDAGQPLTVTWPVYTQGRAGVYMYVTSSAPPFEFLDYERADYATGSFLTNPLPAGYGWVELDYTQPMPGAAARLELQSGPDAGLLPPTSVQYDSWQGAGFTITPEPTALGALPLALAMLRRRARRP